MSDVPVVELKHVNKQFAKVLANDDVSFSIYKGEVVSLLGENGAGKSTIMKCLYGLYKMTSGAIYVDGKECKIDNPRDAMNLGISMIQQHFSLVPAHTVTENIILGTCHGRIDYKEKEKEIQDLAREYQLDVPADAYVKDLPVGTQQKVEILKALYLKARVLIMDEPTAVLTPQESVVLIQFMRNYVKQGNSVVLITHKMNEVLSAADRIIVMRNGRVTGDVKNENVSETDLAHMMIGHDLDEIKKPAWDESQETKVRLQVKDLSMKPKNQAPLLEDINFEIKEGEILGVAGVSGNGQQELCDAIYGAADNVTGQIFLDGEDISQLSVRDRIAKGIGYLVSDRHRHGMVADMSLSENMMLKASYLKEWTNHGLIRQKKLDQNTDEAIQNYSVKAPDHSVTLGSLSGGNQQKMVVAREVEMGDKLMIFDQPTRGLDLGAINYVHKTILHEKEQGKSILLISTELSEIFTLSDRILVLYQGKIMGIYDPNSLTTESIGLLMAGYDPTKEGGEADEK